MAGMTINLVLTEDQLGQIARMVADAMPPKPVDRYEAMAQRLGEACTKKQACQAMNVSMPTLYRMIADGRIRETCDGMRVDVRSMADYIEWKERKGK